MSLPAIWTTDSAELACLYPHWLAPEVLYAGWLEARDGRTLSEHEDSERQRLLATLDWYATHT